ncbi:pyruvate kinase [Planoprotostelium fungivorum]|uniref:Pyruvate kinase n=1 Tax=Planoprotostelium fungivorum TaxID=1890364 RepID=A0A2P6NUZ6_9EUKA|nr:pyruvate kinase [Planoprotostelium fungivorum]
MSKPSEFDCLRRTKIVCSVGPSCEKAEVLSEMLKAGCNVFRINCSFGDYDLLRSYFQEIRKASAQTGLPCAILGDLQGPKFRTGEFTTDTIQLNVGDELDFVATKDKGNEKKITTPNTKLVAALKENDKVLINDGIMEIQVIKKKSDTEAVVKVVRGGELSKRKGLNVPTTEITFDDLEEKDKRDSIFLMENGVDFIGQSFVQNAGDVQRLKKHLEENKKEGQSLPKIIVKIEKPKALENYDAILAETDGVMVARGDLGVELPYIVVPVVQKVLIRKANEAEKPVILATQLLQSMMKETVPLRAEVSDVANGVFDHTDAVMTSGETTMSPHPALVVQTMNDIVSSTEKRAPVKQVSLSHLTDVDEAREAIAFAGLEAAYKSSAKAIVVFSAEGTTALRLSKGRPDCPILAVTPHESVARALRLSFAVYPIVLQFRSSHIEEQIAEVEKKVIEDGLVKRGDKVVICGGRSAPVAIRDALKIYRVGEFLELEEEKRKGVEGVKKQERIVMLSQ